MPSERRRARPRFGVSPRSAWTRYGAAAMNLLGARRYTREALGIQDVPRGAVVVHFAATPAEIYQLEQWAELLHTVDQERPVRIVVNRPDVGRLVSQRTGLPVVFAPSASQLEELVSQRPPAVILYVNHREPNFRLLRHAHIPHVYIGHGESDKGASASHQNLAYDYAFVAGQAGRDRLAAAMPFFDVSVRAPMVGRPMAGSGRGRVDPSRVLYAPTWEGGLPSMALGSVVSHGVPLVRALIAGGFSVTYRPHPLTGTEQSAHREADQAVRTLIAEAGEPHRLDLGPYEQAFDGAALAIVDVSSVAYDWLATDRPFLLTVPTNPAARPLPSMLSERAPRLTAAQAEDGPTVASRVRSLIAEPPTSMRDVAEYHFGDLEVGASTRRFLAALAEVIETWERRQG